MAYRMLVDDLVVMNGATCENAVIRTVDGYDGRDMDRLTVLACATVSEALALVPVSYRRKLQLNHVTDWRGYDLALLTDGLEFASRRMEAALKYIPTEERYILAANSDGTKQRTDPRMKTQMGGGAVSILG